MTRTRKALLMLLALVLLKRPADLLLAVTLPDAAVNSTPMYAAAGLTSLLLLGLPAWQFRPWISPRMRLRRDALMRVVWGVAGAVLCALTVPPLDAAWQGLIGANPTSGVAQTGGWSRALALVTMVIVPALTEEAFFRGALLTSLLDGGRRTTAILLTTLAFALMHGHAAALPGLLVLSMLLALLMLDSGHIAVPIAAHMTYNLIVFQGWTLPLWGSILCGAGLAVMMLGLYLGLSKMAHPPMKKMDGGIAGVTILFLFILYFV